MPIQYIVLEGGGYMGLASLGALNELQKEKFYNIDNIKGIYATSVGAFIGAILCLKMDWDVMLKYVIERPWHKVVTFSSHMLLESLFKRGIFDISFFRESLKNLLQSVDLTINITLLELYEYSHIELHIFSTKLNTFELVDFNYKTHPTMKIIDAIYKSSTLPFIFQPMWYDGSFYLDGGLVNNYPVNKCIADNAIPDEILGIQHNILSKDKGLDKNAHILEYAFFLYKKFFRILRAKSDIAIKNEIIIPCDKVSVIECKELLQNSEMRKKYLINGEKAVRLFLTYAKKNNIH